MVIRHFSRIHEVNISFSLFDPDSLSIYILIGAGSVVILAIVVFFMVLSLKSKINAFRRARRQYEKGRFEKALIPLAIELEKNPGNREALLLKADAEKELERFEDATRDYYHLIRVKEPGDGIDVLTVKKKLLLTLYKQGSLLELHSLCGEILDTESNSPEALYYLSLLYIGQLYFDRAAETLHLLIHNRPLMHEAHFAFGVANIQRGKYTDAVSAFDRALEMSRSYLYLLCSAAAHYFKADYKMCSEVLRNIPQREEVFEKQKQYLFSLKLRAFCNYRLGRYERAVHLLQFRYKLVQRGESPASGIYNRKGLIEEGEAASNEDSALTDYYRLREVAAEEGRRLPPSMHTNHILDVEGLSRITGAGLDLGFAMIKAGSLQAAFDLFSDMREHHPEVLGLKKIIRLIGEERDRTESVRKDTPHLVRSKSTERVIRGEGRGYRLWEYMEEWERNAVRPYQLLIIADFTSRKMLSPRVLLSKDKRIR
jgi:tetratricopeptide (TPR) repeat protein